MRTSQKRIVVSDFKYKTIERIENVIDTFRNKIKHI